MELRVVVVVVIVLLGLAGCGGAHTASSHDTGLALRDLQTRCERGDALPCYDAAAVFEAGAPGIPADPNRMRTLRERGHELTVAACKRDDAASCHRIVLSAKLAYAGTTDVDERMQLVTTMVNAGTRGCHAGDFELCIDIAAIFDKGEAGPPDRERALELVGFACTRDYQPACIELGLVLANKPVDARDRERAGDLFEAACAKSNADGCEMLATYRLSDGPTAAARAREAAHRSCELGDAGGCAVYGHTLLDGIGGPADPDQARKAFDTACRGKDARGCAMLER